MGLPGLAAVGVFLAPIDVMQRILKERDIGTHHSFAIRLNFFRIFRKLFVNFVLSKEFAEIGGAETIRLFRKLSKSELSSRFSGRLKIFIGLGSLAR